MRLYRLTTGLCLLFVPIAGCHPKGSPNNTSETLATTALDKNLQDGSIVDVSCLIARGAKDYADSYCWQAVNLTKDKLAVLSSACASNQGAFSTHALCEGIKDAAQCDYQVQGIRVSGFYPGLRWSNDTAQQICKGTFTAGTYLPLFQASCQLDDPISHLCIDYTDMIAEGKDYFKLDCLGAWRDGSACDVPADTLGCQLVEKNFRGLQTLWYPGRTDIRAMCTNGTIVKAG